MGGLKPLQQALGFIWWIINQLYVFYFCLISPLFHHNKQFGLGWIEILLIQEILHAMYIVSYKIMMHNMTHYGDDIQPLSILAKRHVIT